MNQHHINAKMRTHIARNIRLMEQLYGAAAAVEFKFDAIDFCMERDVEFAQILERSFPNLVVSPNTGHEDWKRKLQERRARLDFTVVESATVNAVTHKKPASNWQEFAW